MTSPISPSQPQKRNIVPVVLVVLGMAAALVIFMASHRFHVTPPPVPEATHRDGPKKSPPLSKPSDPSHRLNANDQALHSPQFEVPVDVNDATDKLRVFSFGNQFEALLKRHRIELPPDELDKAQSAFIKFREQQASLEANLADVSYPSSTQCVLSIPPHAEASSKLLADFMNEISGALTADNATAVNSAVDGDMWMENVLASAEQVQITINGKDPDYSTGTVEIIWTVKSAENGTTLLSRVSILTPAMLVNGEYAYLAQYAAVVLKGH
jgi:hypothetical protein